MHYLITGTPGSGKSTLIKQLVKELERKGKKIAGLISPEVREKGVRQGFKLIDLASGKKEWLASTEIKGKPRVSKYGVNLAGIDRMVGVFLKGFEKADVIIIDELGPMEFYSQKFKEMLEKIFASDKIVIATVHHSIAHKFKGKGKLFTVRRNVEELKEKILQEIV